LHHRFGPSIQRRSRLIQEPACDWRCGICKAASIF
jgi:hypothetical protein